MIELFISLPIDLKVLILAPLTLIVIEKIKEKL